MLGSYRAPSASAGAPRARAAFKRRDRASRAARLAPRECPHCYHHKRGPRRPASTGDAGLTVVGCSCSTRRFEPMNVCTVRRAIVLLLKEKAEVLEAGAARSTPSASRFARPFVIRLDELRARAARRAPAQDHAPRGVRTRQLDLPVLRRAREPHRRPRDPALQGRPVELGEHRRLLRPVQPAQRRPYAAPGEHAPRTARRASRTRRSSSACRARRSPLRGGHTFRHWPDDQCLQGLRSRAIVGERALARGGCWRAGGRRGGRHQRSGCARYGRPAHWARPFRRPWT